MKKRGDARPEQEMRRRSAAARALWTLRTSVRRRSATANERLRVARAYRVLGDNARAAAWYRSAVDELTLRGDALNALAALKEMTEVTPQEHRAFAELARRFAAMQDRDFASGRVAVPLPAQPIPLEKVKRRGPLVLDARELLAVHEAEQLGAAREASAENPLPLLVPPDVLQELHVRGEIELFDLQGNPIPSPADQGSTGDEVPEDAVEVLEENPDLAHVEPRAMEPEEIAGSLSRVPLLSDLEPAAFAELARAVKLRLVGDREYLFREGEKASSFFLVAEGSFEIVRRTKRREVVLSHFNPGQAFGVFGLFAGQRRAASARAIGSALVLQVPASALARVVRKSPAAKAALSRFFKERMLENFLGASPLFEDLDAVARALLIGQFKEKKLATGVPIVSPGEVLNGLFLVVAGALAITKRLGGGRDQELARLERGRFFGVVSAMSGTPCRCSIAAVKPTSLALLPQRSFNDFVKDHPTMRLLPQRLAHEGMLVDKDIFVGDIGIPGLS